MRKLIPVLAILAVLSLMMKEYWYLVWICAGMMSLGFFRTKRLSDWAEFEEKKEEPKDD